MDLVLSPAAVADLRSISEYTVLRWGAEQRDGYLENIWAKLDEIALSPLTFKPRFELFEGCRSARVGKHVVFFVVRGSELEIVRVLHSAMDFGSHFEAG